MVEVTRLNGSRFALNPDLIARMHESPDTTIVMLDGSRYIVAEPMREVIDRIERARARVLVLAQAGRDDLDLLADAAAGSGER